MTINPLLNKLLYTIPLIILSEGYVFAQSFVDLKNEPHSVLPNYVSTPDSIYRWELIERSDTDQGTFLQVSLISQKWRNILWKHRLFVFFPAATPPSTTGFLSLQMGFEASQAQVGLLQLAQNTSVPCAILCDVPNQPLFDGKQEEELLNYTFEQYLQTGDASWPLLLPMVKGAVRAMDALQSLCKQYNFSAFEHFVIAGHSKRGHTAWLTAAVDKRITGIIAQGFNTLNSSAQIPHYLSTYGGLNQSALAAQQVIEKINTPLGQSLLQIVDAYTYREHLKIPKLVIVGTNDDYTPVDALNLYWPGLSGSKSVLSLINANHVGANNDARLYPTAYAFIKSVSEGKQMPMIQSSLLPTKGQMELVITTDESASSARVWIAHSLTQDFREAKWESKQLPLTASSMPKEARFRIEPNERPSGYTALIGEVEFNQQKSRYLLSTTPYVLKNK